MEASMDMFSEQAEAGVAEQATPDPFSAAWLASAVSEKWIEAEKYERVAADVKELEDSVRGGGLRFELPWADSYLFHVIAETYEAVLEQWSRVHNGMTGEVLTTNDLPNEAKWLNGLCTRDPGRIVRCREIAPVDFVRQQLERIDFNAFATALSEAAGWLEDRGLKNAAYTINRHLIGEEPGLVPFRKGKWCEFQFDVYHEHGTYSYRCLEWLVELRDAMVAVQQETGQGGLVAPLHIIARAYQSANYNEPIPYRTVLAEGMVMEGVVRKGGFRLRMKPEIAESLVSFVALHGGG